MSSAELKVDIFRKIDQMDDKYLNKIYAYINQLLDKKNASDEWKNLSEVQKKALLDAINSAEKGKTLSHDKVISKYNDLYRNAL